MGGLVQDLERRLGALEEAHLLRRLEEPRGIDFSSNDYLALAGHPALSAALRRSLEAGRPVGAPASRLLRGNSRHHEALEARLAELKGLEAALLFPTGYQANLGVLTALIGPGDRVLSDRLNHASLIDGLRLTGCRKVIFPHRDVVAVAAELDRPYPRGRTFLVTESLFSMDGDIAPLERYGELCRRSGAELIVDEAHAFGLFGERGSGLVEELGVESEVTAAVCTFGKALGCAGAFVAGPSAVIRWLVNRARTFVFTTAPPPTLLAAVEAALDILEREPGRRRRVSEAAAHLRWSLGQRGLPVVPGEGPIVPVVLGGNRRALAVARHLRRRGFDVRAIRPPTVPAGSSRLRISVHADHRREDLDALVDSLDGALAGHFREEVVV